MATDKKTPAQQAARKPVPTADVEAAAVKHAASVAGERSTYADATPESPNYGGPFIQQTLAPRADGE